MIEITKYVADDGTEFEDEFECMDYESKLSLTYHKNDFILFDDDKCPLSLEDIKSEDVYYIVIKHPCGAVVLGKWFERCGDVNPFEFTAEKNYVGTWAYTDSMGWIQLENEVQRYISTIAELNK